MIEVPNASHVVDSPTHFPVERHTTSKSKERRIRKMSQEYQPSTFTFRAQAHILCVGTAVVYRVTIAMTMTTTGIVGTGGSSADGYSSHSWVIAMSRAKFHAFEAHASTILRLPSVTDYLQHIDEGWQPFAHFLRRLVDILDSYHCLQYAFEVSADVELMNEGRRKLEAFLGDCWRSLEIVIPALAIESQQSTSLGREVWTMYTLIRDILAFPESILEANCVYARAVSSLEDAEDIIRVTGDRACSICLEPLSCSSFQAPGDQPELTISDDIELHGDSTYSVTLQCGHLFHENCVMAWLRHNPSCPDCRACVGLHWRTTS